MVGTLEILRRLGILRILGRYEKSGVLGIFGRVGEGVGVRVSV